MAEYTVSYIVTSYYTLVVERPDDIDVNDIPASITRDELMGGDESGGWDGLKDAWRNQDISFVATEEDTYYPIETKDGSLQLVRD